MIRLLLICLFTAVSILAVCKAPTYHLWMLAVGVTEFPWIFALLMMVLLLSGIWATAYLWSGTLIGLIGLGLYLSPMARAYGVASGLPSGLDAAFGLSKSPLPSKSPFQWTGMIPIHRTPEMPFKTYTYTTYGDTAMTLDFYRSEGRRPCVLIVHGGSWSGGDSRQLPDLNSELVRQGYAVATMNYRLAPLYQSPAPMEDVASALRWLRERSDRLGIDTSNFVLLGRSAGAQIALMAAYTLSGTPAGAGLKGVISFYGPADMVWGYSIPSNLLVMDSRKVMEDYLGGTYEAVPEHYVASSPIEAVTTQSPPTLLIHGRNDVLVAYEHSIRLSKKLKADRVPYFLLTLPWATHGADFNLWGPSGQLSTYAVESFLIRITR
jgi:acetyl esterase/lipase